MYLELVRYFSESLQYQPLPCSCRGIPSKYEDIVYPSHDRLPDLTTLTTRLREEYRHWSRQCPIRRQVVKVQSAGERCQAREDRPSQTWGRQRYGT